MKTKTAISALALIVLSWTGTAAAKSHICIDGADISYTSEPDDQTIVFHMNNGRVWRNTLRQICPNLKFEHAFSEVVRGGEICANEQMIRVHETGNVCALGDFTLMSAPPKP